MDNPWIQLSHTPPYVLDIDREAIRKNNTKLEESHRHWIHTELRPEPYLGNPSSPVVLLTGNPGYHPEDFKSHQNPAFKQASRNNIVHRDTDYPLYLINPDLSDAPGFQYWTQKLGSLIKEFDSKHIANKVFIVEYHGYHSLKFKTFSRNNMLPSQKYSFALVQQAINNNAAIIIMRNRRNWINSMQQLESYPHLFTVRSVQNPTITRNNCDGYSEILQRLSV